MISNISIRFKHSVINTLIVSTSLTNNLYYIIFQINIFLSEYNIYKNVKLKYIIEEDISL